MKITNTKTILENETKFNEVISLISAAQQTINKTPFQFLEQIKFANLRDQDNHITRQFVDFITPKKNNKSGFDSLLIDATEKQCKECFGINYTTYQKYIFTPYNEMLDKNGDVTLNETDKISEKISHDVKKGVKNVFTTDLEFGFPQNNEKTKESFLTLVKIARSLPIEEQPQFAGLLAKHRVEKHIELAVKTYQQELKNNNSKTLG